MTATANPTLLPPCPSWCENRFPQHQEEPESETFDGRLLRSHEIDWPTVESSEVRPPHLKIQPYASVSVIRDDVMDNAGSYVPRPTFVALFSEHSPSYTPGEARKLAAQLIEAADRVDEIEGAR